MTQRPQHQETTFRPFSGWLMLPVNLALIFGPLAAIIATVKDHRHPLWYVALAFTTLFGVLLICGHFVISPNQSRVLVLFGRYRGTVRDDGFWWTNPFTVRKLVSLRAHNLNGKALKVNDLLGNPIEIAAVVVWRVKNTAAAVFDVENYEEYVAVQSESAVRQLAQSHPYDAGHTDVTATSLRGSDEVAHELKRYLETRLEQAGIEVIEARLSHLAYAPEIAAAMLQRQQATAIIAARSMIVEGAVGMVEQALQRLAEKQVIELDAERKATLVGNLLVVLCAHENPTPVLNTGTLYN
ncbi:MAG: SPFH domain-containing protein [Planctomycetes bacterium]|nr:SPFH domain-containing protein [Planctomycetota bacterium]